ncbi:MAG: DNA double-strand break repair nuclease NurA [Thermostichales cyanobacterium SZTDM-1c_bins_54]
MVLRAGPILQALQRKQAELSRFDREVALTQGRYSRAMQDLAALSWVEIAQRCAQVPWPGAIPTPEWGQGWNLPFGQVWDNQEQSREWVTATIANVATFAVDGSQLDPGKDISLPLALIQIGWYENRHTPQGDYEKDIRVDLLTPTELGTGNEPKERRIHARRLQMELERLREYLRDPPHRPCLAFLDGSLIATFAEWYEAEEQAWYAEQLVALLRDSQYYQTPLVAYIDTTYSRDLVNLLQVVFELPEAPHLHDAQLLSPYLSNWGDRSPYFLSARGGILSRYQEMRDRVGFVYVKTGQDRYPVRLELPHWLVEQGLLNQVLDWVRCEVVIGGGYPYVIETADQTAVLQAADRYQFLRLLQDWSAAHQIRLSLSRKSISKIQRRR